MKAFAGYALENSTHTINSNNMWDSAISPKFNTGAFRGGDWLGSNWNYGPGVVQKLFGYLIARKTATGVDNISDFTWGLNHINYKAGALHPDRASVYTGGPWSGNLAGVTTDGDMVYASYALKDTKKGREIQHYINKLITRVEYRAKPWEYFLWYLPSRASEDYTLTMPLQYRAEGVGTVSMRSSWDNTATWAMYRGGGGLDSQWEDADQGHFEIWKNSWQAVNAGMWTQDGIQTFNWVQNSNWRNTMTVDDKGEGYMTYPFVQAVWGISETSQPAYEVGVDYVYVYSDLKGAYKSNLGKNPLINYYRQFVFLKPDYFIVFDRATTVKSYYTKTWLLHWPGIPTITGDSASSMYNGGKLFFKSLSPDNTNISSVALVAGKPNNLHRMSVVSVDNNASEIFLNVLYVADGTVSNMPETVKITSSTGNMIGAHIKMAGTNKIAMFSNAVDNTPVNGIVNYSYTATVPIVHYLFGLVPNANYTIIDSGSDITFTPGSGTKLSSPEGVLIY